MKQIKNLSGLPSINRRSAGVVGRSTQNENYAADKKQRHTGKMNRHLRSPFHVNNLIYRASEVATMVNLSALVILVGLYPGLSQDEMAYARARNFSSRFICSQQDPYKVFAEGQLELIGAGPNEISKSYFFGLYKATASVPHHIRVEYNGQHYVFGNVNAIKSIPAYEDDKTGIDYGQLGAHPRSELTSFIKNPDLWITTHKSEEQFIESAGGPMYVKSTPLESAVAMEAVNPKMNSIGNYVIRKSITGYLNKQNLSANNGNVNAVANNTASTKPTT